MDSQGPVVADGDGVDDPQSESFRVLVGWRSTGVGVGVGEAGSGVGDDDAHRGVGDARGEPHLAPARGVAQGVVEQVYQGLAQS